MSFYYLVASLPMLRFGEAPQQKPDDFLFQCAGMISAAEHADLGTILYGEQRTASSPAARQWQNADTQLRNAIARQRAGRRNVDAKNWIHDHDGFVALIEERVQEAFQKGNPLDRERAFDLLRWTLADECIGDNPFSFGALVAYAVKLRIATRWALHKDSTGKDNVDAFIYQQLENPEPA